MDSHMPGGLPCTFGKGHARGGVEGACSHRGIVKLVSRAVDANKHTKKGETWRAQSWTRKLAHVLGRRPRNRKRMVDSERNDAKKEDRRIARAWSCIRNENFLPSLSEPVSRYQNRVFVEGLALLAEKELRHFAL